MIIDTPDDRSLEAIHCQGNRLFLCIENMHGAKRQ